MLDIVSSMMGRGRAGEGQGKGRVGCNGTGGEWRQGGQIGNNEAHHILSPILSLRGQHGTIWTWASYLADAGLSCHKKLTPGQEEEHPFTSWRPPSCKISAECSTSQAGVAWQQGDLDRTGLPTKCYIAIRRSILTFENSGSLGKRPCARCIVFHGFPYIRCFH